MHPDAVLILHFYRSSSNFGEVPISKPPKQEEADRDIPNRGVVSLTAFSAPRLRPKVLGLKTFWVFYISRSMCIK